MEKKSVLVRVAGRDYQLASRDSEERVRLVAAQVDRRMGEYMASLGLSRETAAVMVALTLTDELQTAQEDNARLRRELRTAQERLAALENA